MQLVNLHSTVRARKVPTYLGTSWYLSTRVGRKGWAVDMGHTFLLGVPAIQHASTWELSFLKRKEHSLSCAGPLSP